MNDHELADFTRQSTDVLDYNFSLNCFEGFESEVERFYFYKESVHRSKCFNCGVWKRSKKRM